MPIFNYTVANKQGKELSGSIETPDEQSARAELNNLGFSIVALKQSDQVAEHQSDSTRFVFEAIDARGRSISGTIPSSDKNEALKRLKDEYGLTTSAIWPQGASQEEIDKARREGTQQSPQAEEISNADLDQQKKEEVIKERIEFVLKKIHELLRRFERDIDLDKRAEIEKRIDKLLRIKRSTNLEYVVTTTKEILKFIQEQEESMQSKGMIDKRIELRMRTKSLLTELNRGMGNNGIGEKVSAEIDQLSKGGNAFQKLIAKILLPIKKAFTKPPEIKKLEEQIKVYNQQIWEFIKLYFREPTPEYKEKVKRTIYTIWNQRKLTKEKIKTIKKSLKEKRKQEIQISGNSFSSLFSEEISSFSGWLLFFYLAYYFLSLYINSKNFGITEIPKGLSVYDSYLFKYVLAIIFLLHISTAVKVNFFRKSRLADFVLIPFFIITSIIVILNY